MADKKVYYSWQEIEDMTSDIAQQIAVDNDGFKPDYVVGLTRGGLIPATMLSHYFRSAYAHIRNKVARSCNYS